MSTFDGIVDEFPSIRIDQFRNKPGRNPPQACFLSHIHSDHLQGLDTLKMPFVYCSAATKKILLRMEKYPHRINFAKGILEARKQTYKHLKLVLRSLPLETPVEIELDPKSRIQVTLFDANHCPGAVMFLVEGNGRAILYTGDVRAESWWVNSIVRNPILLQYSCGMKRLDCIYLDTTFASHDDPYQTFPTKAEGVRELLGKLEKCPKDSIFYFRSWTLGYEDVWIALSHFLDTPIHVDDYQMRIFSALAEDNVSSDQGAFLCGFKFGNHYQPGCLTDDESVRVHSCEPGTRCHDTIKKRSNIVWISPIISRLKDGTEIAEIGAGGGGGDLYQTPQLEVVDEMALKALEELCTSSVKQEALARLTQAFSAARERGEMKVSLEGIGLEQDEEVTLKDFVKLISTKGKLSSKKDTSPLDSQRIIHFPYSRHSSYLELCHLVSSFKPRDICPCTVDVDNWSEDVSMRSLFGDICSETTFRYDKRTKDLAEQMEQHRALTSRGNKRKRQASVDESQSTDQEESEDTSNIYKSARTSMREEDKSDRQVQTAEDETDATATPSAVKELHEVITTKLNERVNTYTTRLGITSTRSTTNHDRPTSIHVPSPISTQINDLQTKRNEYTSIPDPDSDTDTDSNSTTSLPSSTFQPTDLEIPPIFTRQPTPKHRTRHKLTATSNRDRDRNPAEQAHHEAITSSTITDPVTSTNRIESRKRAYSAARRVLLLNDPSAWQDLRLRSMGWKGHIEEETLL